MAFVDERRSWISDQNDQLRIIVSDYELDPEGAAARLQSQHRLLQNFLHLLESLQGSRTDDVPWSIIPSIERLAEQLLPGRQLLTTTLPTFNYMIRWYPGSPDPRRFFILYLPRILRSHPFLHVSIGHELFHPILEPYLTRERPRVSKHFKVRCSEILKSLGDDEDLFSGPRLDTLIETTLDVWEKGLSEVMCDLGCASIFGPAAILSLSLFALSHSLDEVPTQAGQYYPPWRYRLRAVLKLAIDSEKAKKSIRHLRDVLDQAALGTTSKDLQDRLDSLRELSEDTRDLTAINANAILRLAYDSIEDSLPSAWEFVEKCAERVSQRWDESLGEIPLLLQSLNNLIPPSECRRAGSRDCTAASVSAIANAGWLYQLNQEKNISPLDGLDAFHRTCRLLLKAYEDSEMKNQFDKHRSEVSSDVNPVPSRNLGSD